MLTHIRTPFFVLAVVGLSAAPMGAIASLEADDYSKHRTEVMKEMDSAISNISNQTYGLFPYDKEDVVEKARKIRSGLDRVPDLFPKGSASISTKPVIWKKPTAFKKALQKVVKRADALVATAETKDKHAVVSELKKLHKACNSCHAKFRK